MNSDKILLSRNANVFPSVRVGFVAIQTKISEWNLTVLEKASNVFGLELRGLGELSGVRAWQPAAHR